MRTRTKIWLMIATLFVLSGCVLFVGIMTILGWDFRKLATVKYETNTYEVMEGFDCISINTGTADIQFVLSENGKCKVECYEEEYAKHSVTVKDGSLHIELLDERFVHGMSGYVGLNFDSPKITVYLPKTEYTSLLICESTGNLIIPKEFIFKDVDISISTGDIDFCASASDRINIKTSTGDIRIGNLSTFSLNLTVSTGKVTATDVNCEGDVTVNVSTGKTYLTNIGCKNVISTGSTGDIILNHVVSRETFSIKRSTGDVRIEDSDAAEIFIETDTGDVDGTLLTEKIFLIETDTGRVKVPNSVTGGRCQITTDTGDITLRIQN